MASTAMASYFNYDAPANTYPTPENPASGIWIQQVGDLIPQAPTNATLYYTKYKENDRVKSISYTYDGEGYLLMKPSDKKTLCTMSDGVNGADGIVHHPGGKHLLVAGQGHPVYMVNKETAAGGKCLVKTARDNDNGTSGFWHLMVDPTQKILWGAGIPGPLYRFPTGKDASPESFSSEGYKVKLTADASNYRKDDQLATIVWDANGVAYFTYSSYTGGGCEDICDKNGNCNKCSASNRKSKAAGAYFGYFSDTTWYTIKNGEESKYGGKAGDRVITGFKTKILIDSLEGAHGGTYDPYSKTIFVFGGSRIVQIEPFTNKTTGKPDARVVAYIDLREYFFGDRGFTGNRTYDNGYIGWRLDQGTTDQHGHLFVASNTGHMVFIDFAGNRNKRIDNNVLVHVQWIDNFLDDLAPLEVKDGDRTGGATDSTIIVSSSSRHSSSSRAIYEESSSSVKSSSSNKSSSSSYSSGSNPPGSSGSNPPGSSGSNPGCEEGDDECTDSSSSGSNPPGSSGSTPGCEEGDEECANSSSSGEGVGSSGSNPGCEDDDEECKNNSSSSNGPGSSGSDDNGSSSSRRNGSGDDELGSSSSSRLYYGADDEVDDDDDPLDSYPTAESFDRGDSVVSGAVLVPVDPNSDDPNVVEIGGNKYLLTNDPKGESLNLVYRSDKGIDSARVGSVVAITLDPDKVKEYFGDADSLRVVGNNGVHLVNPSTGEVQENMKINNDGSITIFVTADSVVQDGVIKILGNDNLVVIDNIKFYDPIPDSYIGYIKDTKGDNLLDYVEVLLKDSISSNYEVDAVWLIVNGESFACDIAKTQLNKTRDRVHVDVTDLEDKLPKMGEFPKDAKVVVSYHKNGSMEASFTRETNLVEVGSNVIKDAYAIRDTSKDGSDSLFLQFNINLIPPDVNDAEKLILIKQEVCKTTTKLETYGLCAMKFDQIDKVYMPSKDIIILVAKDFGLAGDMKDSVSLYPGKVFDNLQHITSDEYEREVPVTVVDRFPSLLEAEYWDTDGDGVLDEIVSVFDRKLTAEEIDATLYLTFPWFSSRGMTTYLQADPSSLVVDSKDSSRVVWKVTSVTPLAKGVTSINDKLPPVTAYTYYKIFGETFVSEATASQVDKMPPLVSSATLSYGKTKDTLVVFFTEPVVEPEEGKDFFSYIHGSEVIDLNPSRIDWSKDGFSATLILDGMDVTLLPGDSLLVKRGKLGEIRDNAGNIAGEKPQAVIIGGLLNHLVDAAQMGSYDVNDEIGEGDDKYALKTASSVNLRYVPGTTTKEDMEKQGHVGHLIQLGERFVPRLLDGAQISNDGTFDPTALDSLKPEDVYISVIINFSDHLGQYVNDTIITVPCNSPKFGGNCLSTDKKVFVNWNFKDHNGRFVGSGVYTVQFKMMIRYKEKRIVEEMKDKWGVRRKKHSKKK